MKLKLIFLIILVTVNPLLTQKVYAQAPVIDGDPSDDIWNMAQLHKIKFSNGVFFNFSFIIVDPEIYFLIGIPHNGANDEINLDPAFNHDYFGIEFDRNNDNVIHGVSESPDDMVLVNYFQKGAQDFFTHNFKVFNDTSEGGQEDARGAANSMNGIIYFEIAKKTDSGDAQGNDIKLKNKNTFSALLSFWDDRPVKDTKIIINQAQNGRIFLQFTLDDDLIFASIVLFSGLFVTLIVILKFYRVNKNLSN